MTNIEIKVRYEKTLRTKNILKKIGARFEKIEFQIDTYYPVESGRLKIRERDSGRPQLIQYFRKDETGPRPSYYEIVHLSEVEKVKETLKNEHGVGVVVKKRREIWIWENVRIHFDDVENLGSFLEFEAVMKEGGDVEDEKKKVELMMKKFGVREEDLLSSSYSDLLVQ